MPKRIIIGLAAVALAVTSCSSYNDKRGRGDAPVGARDETKADIVFFPDRFANIATKCDGHGHRLYVTTRDAPPVVIPDHNCPGGGD